MQARHRLFILFFLLIAICYSNSFLCDWQLDDKPNIVNNRHMQITSLSFDQLWQSMHARPAAGGLYRPVAMLSLALNWYLGKSNVIGYHIVNLMIHIGSSWFLFLLITLIFNTPTLHGRYTDKQITFIAVAASLFWALNPVQTQAVTYIVQRMASLSAMFSIVSLYFYLKARLSIGCKSQAAFFLIAGVCYLFALFSKQNAVLIVLTPLVFECLFFQPKYTAKQVWVVGLGFAIALFVLLLIGINSRPGGLHFIFNYYNNRPFSMVERLLTEQRVLLFYLSQLFYPSPSRLSIAHDIELSTSLFSPWTTAAAISVILLLILLALRVRRRYPFFTLAVLFFFINHIVESTIVPLELIFEHRNYLPSIFLFLPVAQALNFVSARMKDYKRGVVAFHLVLAMVFMIEGYWTYSRNKVWKTQQSLWIDAMVKAPNSARPMATLAILLAWDEHPSEFKYRKALELTERTLAMRMSRRRLDAAQIGNMASIYNKLGDYDKATEYYEKALTLAPKDVSARYNLAKNLIKAGDFRRSRIEIEKILSDGFNHADYHFVLGFNDLWLNNPSRALSSLQTAFKLSPNRPDILLALGSCMSDLQYYQRAMWFFKRAQEAGGDDVILSMRALQNVLLKGDVIAVKKIWNRMLDRYPIPKIFEAVQPSTEQYQNVPLSLEVLRPFIQAEVALIQLQY